MVLGCASAPSSRAVAPAPEPEVVVASTPDARLAPLPDVEPVEEASSRASTPTVVEKSDLDRPHLPDVSAAGSKRGERPGPGRGWSDEDLTRIRAVQPIVRAAAAEFGVDAGLVNGLIWVESKFQRKARGPAGAQGYMQLMPRTARGIARRLEERARPYDAEWNIRAGTFTLSRTLARFEGDEILALAAYNRGTGTVLGWQTRGEGVPERAKAYAQRVLRAREWFVAAGRAGLLEPRDPAAPAVAARGGPGPRAG